MTILENQVIGFIAIIKKRDRSVQQIHDYNMQLLQISQITNLE